MATTQATTGSFAGRFSFVRIDGGPAPLVVLPGLTLTNGAPRGIAVTAYARGFARLARDHTLYVVQRPQGLRDGTTTADLGAEYAAVLGAEIGRFDLMGLSTGGLIAQQLALAHPDAVRRLALVVSGARLAPSGQRICRHWLDLARAQRWRELQGDMAAEVVDGRVLRRLARMVMSVTSTAPTDIEAADFLITTSAVLAHDTSAALAGLAMPALVLGGSVDAFFPADALAATAAAIPDAELKVFPGHGHGVPKQRSGPMQGAVAAFLGAGR
jgi:pimeloyl-ACP methyl ester carboxylesterase